MRIGVTGASGFIGSRLLKALERLPGVSVSAFRRNLGNLSPGVEDFNPFVEDKDLIYHLGGVNRGTGAEILGGNVLATFNLVEAVKARGLPTARIVFASSSQVYKLERVKAPVRENRATEPANLYGLAKRTAEELIRLSGLDYSVLRLSNVYGPGCRPDYNSAIATFCDRAARGLTLTVNGDGRQGRDFIFVDDAVRALELAGTRPGKNARTVFNVGSGKIVSLRQIVEQIRRLCPGLQVEYRREADSGGVSYCCDSAQFRERYGWKPKTPLAEGMRQTFRWFQERTRS